MISWEFFAQLVETIIILPLALIGLVLVIWKHRPTPPVKQIPSRQPPKWNKVPQPRPVVQRLRDQNRNDLIRIQAQRRQERERLLLIFLRNELQTLLHEVAKKQNASTAIFSEVKTKIHDTYCALHARIANNGAVRIPRLP